MAYQFSNNATTTLASGITNVATSLTVASGKGALFPTPSGGNNFQCTLVRASDGAIEIVNVTARTTDTFTITRAQEGTTALAFVTGDKVELRLTKAILDKLPQLDGSGNLAISGTITGTSFSGAGTGLTGTASSLTAGAATNATNATNTTNVGVTDDAATASAVYVSWVEANTGNTPTKTTSTKLTFVPSTGVLSSTSFSGAGTGLTGTASSLTAGAVTNGVYTNSSAAISGNNHITFGPNSGWSAYLRIGGNGRTASGAMASVATTNGNLHIDAADGASATYLNFYAGTAGTNFGNGAGATVAVMGPDGDLWKGAADNTGTQYVYNSGSWGISVTGSSASCTGNAATATSATTATNATNVAIAADTTTAATFYIPYASATTGNVALKGTRLTVTPSTGDFTAAGNVTAYSDERLKINWKGFDSNIVAKLAEVKVGIYERTDTEATQVGVSAQSLQAVLPNAVNTGEDGMLSVAYGNAALAMCVELAKKVVALEARIAKLEGSK